MKLRKGKGWWWGGLLAVLLVGLGLLCCRREVALVRIADLQPVQNSVVVRIAGKAVGSAQVSRDAGKISGLRFEVADDTGQLAVMADAQQARQLARWDRIPRAGDDIEVTGRLCTGAGAGLCLQLLKDRALKLRRHHDRRNAVAVETSAIRPVAIPSSSNGAARLPRP